MSAWAGPYHLFLTPSIRNRIQSAQPPDLRAPTGPKPRSEAPSFGGPDRPTGSGGSALAPRPLSTSRPCRKGGANPAPMIPETSLRLIQARTRRQAKPARPGAAKIPRTDLERGFGSPGTTGRRSGNPPSRPFYLAPKPPANSVRIQERATPEAQDECERKTSCELSYPKLHSVRRSKAFKRTSHFPVKPWRSARSRGVCSNIRRRPGTFTLIIWSIAPGFGLWL